MIDISINEVEAVEDPLKQEQLLAQQEAEFNSILKEMKTDTTIAQA